MAEVQQLKEQAMAAVEALRAEAVAIALDIHAHPETGWETPRSAGVLTGFMERHGMEVERGVADLENAFRAGIPGRADVRPAICLLAEYDALPGLGHACGHNLIGTASATAGIALSKVLGDVPGNVIVMGTPFEEGGGGKIIMLERGVFDGCDAAMMFHPAGDVVVASRNIAATMMTYKFYGQAAHAAAAPHLGRNAADAAMLTFTAVNALRQHVRSDARIHGIIRHGGDAGNIVPEYAEVEMMARALDQKYLNELRERVHNCARAGAMAAGVRLEIEQGMTYFERLPVTAMTDAVAANVRQLGYEVPDGIQQTFASADSGNVSYKLPYAGFTLPIDTKRSQPHTPEFATAAGSQMGVDAMIAAAKVLACTAIDLLTDPALLARAQAEHAAAVAAATA